MKPFNQDWHGLLAVLEVEGGQLTPLSRELAALAWALGREAQAEAWGLLIDGPAPAESYERMLLGLPLEKIIVYSSAALAGFKADVQAAVLRDGLDFMRPSVVLIGATDRGKDLAPLVAAGYGSGLTADCTGLKIIEGGHLLQTRPAFGGNVMADILTPETRPQFATVRAGAISGLGSAPAGRSEISLRGWPDSEAGGLRILERQTLPTENSLEQAGRIIAVGCGLKAEADLEPIRDLAGRLGGVMASTRGLVERGWMPPESQIGLSGHSVAPDLLLTLGVSGSVQFRAGLGGAKYIIAVNNDPEAGIFSIAHLGLCVDLYEVVEALLKRSPPDAIEHR